jgi:predicted nucleic acid-binding protein
MSTRDLTSKGCSRRLGSSAADAIEHRALWVTLDDFARFPGLRWAPPS